DPDGTSFWSADQGNGTVAKFDIGSGKLLESFVSVPSGAYGLVVVGELQPATGTALTLSPVDPTAEAIVGNMVTYTMKAGNLGAAIAANLAVAVTLPAGATFESSSCSTGSTPWVHNGVATFPLGNLDPGSSATISIVVRADVKGTLVVAATASSDTPNTTP